jgi:hypothetical protein
MTRRVITAADPHDQADVSMDKGSAGSYAGGEHSPSRPVLQRAKRFRKNVWKER